MTYIHPDIDVLARTLWGEARNQGSGGMRAVAHVVINRVRQPGWWGKTVAGVCRKARQFSCWNKGDPNRAKLERVTMRDPHFRLCLRAAAEALAGLSKDPTGGATHFMTKARHREGWPKSWGKPKKPCAAIGDHLFFKGIK